jgi:hypothetical protein
MEEILASIRRILNEDETSAPVEPPVAGPSLPSAATPADETEADDDVLVLDRSMLVATPGDDPTPASPTPEPDPAPAAIAKEPEPVPPPPQPMDFDAVPARESALLAPETAAAAASSVDGLLRTLAASRSTQVYRGGPTIEDLVREEIRPLLKEWLDGHLPGLVERLVRAEIERVVGRAVS